MTTAQGYMYSALWFIVAVYMIYLAFREKKFFFTLGVYFLFMSGWYLANNLIPDVDLFSGVYSWIFRGVSVVTLIICGVVYFNFKKKNAEK